MRPSAEDRFWSKVVRGEGCWEWGGHRDPRKGYGQFWLNGRNQQAHRVAWMFANGPIRNGLFVCHRCDNPACVRPGHLFLGTHQDNMNDKVAKGRQARGPEFVRHRRRPVSVRLRKDSRPIAAHGETLTPTEWARRLGVTKHTIFWRLRNGWDPVDAVTRPGRFSSQSAEVEVLNG